MSKIVIELREWFEEWVSILLAFAIALGIIGGLWYLIDRIVSFLNW